jgi:TPR repeat protein
LELELRKKRRLPAIVAFAAAAAVVMLGLFLKDRSLQPKGSEGFSMLAWLYSSGKGIPKNTSASLKWARRAAETGDAKAQLAFAEMLLHEKTDIDEAIKWLSVAGDQGERTGYWLLAEMYLHGENVKTNTAEGLKWLSKLADEGDPNANFQAALIYSEGVGGVAKDDAKAFQHMLKAAQLGVVGAFRIVSVMYYNGEGTERDPKAALQWAQKAAAIGDVQAMRLLGIYDFEDKGVPRDLVESAKWLTISESIAPDPVLKSLLEQIQQELSPEQRAEVTRRIQSLTARTNAPPKSVRK